MEISSLKSFIIAKNTVQILQENGFEAFIVGGAVRDLLIGFTPKDFDIATSAKIEDLERLFPYKANERSKSFLVYAFKIENVEIEISCFRNELNIKNRNSLPIYGNMKTDFLRRDFTINALYYNPLENKIWDFSTGIQDIGERTLRPVRDPDVLFAEDAVRVVRAIRFQREFNLSFSFDINKYVKEVNWNDPRVKQEVDKIRKYHLKTQ